MFLNIVNAFFLNRFNACWVPDSIDHMLTGKLSQSKKIKNARFVGLLSRLKKQAHPQKNDIAIILSGPEPSRTILEKNLCSTLKTINKNIVLVRGSNQLCNLSMPDNWTIKNRLNSQQINELLLSSKKIISRSGYSSVMDYKHLGLPAILIPTPGQSEQEYLGEYLNGKFGFVSIKESNLHQLEKLLYDKQIRSSH
jgi:predicted glycosyltransferase